MAKLLNLHRAARLVGVTRGALQKRIQDGELDSFDGMITLTELQRVFPDVAVENSGALEEVSQIKELAFGQRIRDRALPDKEVLAARVHELSKELVESKALLTHYRDMLQGLDHMLDEDIAKQQVYAKRLKDWLVAQSLQQPPSSDATRSLLIRDNFLRVMTAQVTVQPSGADFFVEGKDTILEAALRAGVALGYGCASGSCGKCMARVVSGEIKPVRPHEYVIPTQLQEQGYALMCSCTAISDVVIEGAVAHHPDDLPDQLISGTVRAIEYPSDEVAVLHIKTPKNERLRFLAGQRAVLTIGNSLAQQLTIASCPCEDQHLEFHVRRMTGNLFADYVFKHLKAGDAVSVRGPLGQFVLNSESTRPIIFLAFCNGFAAVKSLMEHAMALDQAESIHLIWIATNETGIYLPGLARAWADALDNFVFKPVVVGSDLDTTASRQEDAITHVLGPLLQDIPSLTRSDIYIAGQALAVDVMKKTLLGLAVPEAQIIVDRD